MSGDLDQISLQIGRIQSVLEEGTRQRDAMFRKLDTMADRLSEVGGRVAMVADGHANLKAKIDGQIIPAIDDMKSLKAKGLGVLAAIGLLAGGAGSGITKILAKLTEH
jgi:hypothetical protein